MATPPAAPIISAAGPFIQIGFFSVKANADRAVATLQAAGISASIRNETSQGKPYWSVGTRGDAGVLAKIKAAGFKDAYITKG
jgi:cell division protein FtsN